jgi:hypothetical protein
MFHNLKEEEKAKLGMVADVRAHAKVQHLPGRPRAIILLPSLELASQVMVRHDLRD